MAKKKNIPNNTNKEFKVSPEEYQILKEDFGDLKAYLEEIRRTLPVGLCTTGIRGPINDVNQSFLKLTGYKLLEIIGKPIQSIFSPKKEIEKILEEVGKVKLIKYKEITLISKEKKEIPVSISISQREDFEGNPIGYFITITDITEAKESQKRLQEKVEELENFQKLAVGRELKMMELKKEVVNLKEELKKLEKIRR